MSSMFRKLPSTKKKYTIVLGISKVAKETIGIKRATKYQILEEL